MAWTSQRMIQKKKTGKGNTFPVFMLQVSLDPHSSNFNSYMKGDVVMIFENQIAINEEAIFSKDNKNPVFIVLSSGSSLFAKGIKAVTKS